MTKESKMLIGGQNVFPKIISTKGISMARYRTYGWGVGLTTGLVIGLVLGGLWPDTPLHASATDRVENFAVATGFVAEGVEAVFYLDYLTGNLTGAVPSRRMKGFQAAFSTNVHEDLKQALATTGSPVPQSPSYLMVTGTIDLANQGGGVFFGNTMIYVAETNTGVVMAYAVPWSREAHSGNKFFSAKLIPWAGQQFGAAMLRPE